MQCGFQAAHIAVLPEFCQCAHVYLYIFRPASDAEAAGTGKFAIQMMVIRKQQPATTSLQISIPKAGELPVGSRLQGFRAAVHARFV
jgi:hypothetical protein